MVKLQTEQGKIVIANDVITKLAGLAATNCFGVKGMAVCGVNDGLVHLLRREAVEKGVSILYNEDESISIELHIIVDHGVNLVALCESIISEVRYKVNKATRITIKAVDVYIDSMVVC